MPTGDGASARGVVASSNVGGVDAEAEEGAGYSSGGTTRTASRRNTLAPRSNTSPRAAAPCTRACAACASSCRLCASLTLSGIVSRRVVRRSGGSEDCRRVKSVWELACCCGCRSSCCGSGSVAVEADAEEVAEPSLSGVVVSTRSRETGVSLSVAGVEELTERVANCSLSPFCAWETYSPRSLRAASIALWLFRDNEDSD